MDGWTHEHKIRELEEVVDKLRLENDAVKDLNSVLQEEKDQALRILEETERNFSHLRNEYERKLTDTEYEARDLVDKVRRLENALRNKDNLIYSLERRLRDSA